MTPAPLLLTALVALGASIAIGARVPKTWLALTLLGSAAAFVAAAVVLLGGPAWEWRSEFLLGGEPVHARLDGLSALFLSLLSVVGGAGAAAYSREYWSDEHRPASAPRGRAWWSGLVTSMGLVLTASNGVHLLVAWEAFTVCAYFLVTLDRTRRDVRAAGWLYLAASHVGTVFLFAFFALLSARTGGYDLGPMRERTELAPLFWLALCGFGVKAGLFPLHVWLPSTHANAPSHVSAIMSGVAIKMGVYGLMRFSGWLPVPVEAGFTLMGLGAIGAVLGIAFALAQNDVKRLLAYCSVENVGILLIGLGGALLARAQGDAPWGRLVLAGTLLHVWNHGAFKSLLFLCAGSVLHATGTRELSRFGGLWRAMPWTAGLFAVGSLAVVGLPPLNGFVGEWLVYLGLFDAATSRAPATWATIPAAIAMATAGALSLATFVKAGSLTFLGAPRTRSAALARECGSWMRAPMFALGGACIVIGLVPAILRPALARAVEAFEPAFRDGTTNAPLVALGRVHVVLAIVAAAAGIFVWRKSRANGLVRGLTWDCGYAAPTARMQYTGGSFARIATGWFGFVLRPTRRLRRPKGPFPTSAIRLERVPETVLERLVVPVGVALLAVSTTVRRLQHGRLQAYILYLVLGLAALAAIVATGHA